MTLTEIRRLLEEWKVRPKRRYGQNFMFDQNVVRRIVEAADPKEGATVLEIGPGLGALTEFLVKTNPKMALIEQDQTFIPHLQSSFPDAKVIQGDAMEKISDFEFKISDGLVIGNLPYSVASPLMVRLCEPLLRPSKMVFTIQWEVAERLTAKPNTKDFGLLTLLTQAFYEIELLRKVPPSVFWPEPEVDSAVVVMNRRKESMFESTAEELAFREISKKAFQKRRKTLGAIFGSELPEGVDRTRRPENLSLMEWVDFARKKNMKNEEYFDVVDECDQVIGSKPRSQVHRENLLHRAVHIFIWNGKGELLLQKRSLWKDKAPGTWDSSAAGHLSAGEEYDPAAQREILEEIGVDPVLKRVKRFEACEALGWEFVWLYQGESEGPFRFPESEISELRWWSASEIDRSIQDGSKEFAQSFIHIWKHR